MSMLYLAKARVNGKLSMCLWRKSIVLLSHRLYKLFVQGALNLCGTDEPPGCIIRIRGNSLVHSAHTFIQLEMIIDYHVFMFK